MSYSVLLAIKPVPPHGCQTCNVMCCLSCELVSKPDSRVCRYFTCQLNSTHLVSKRKSLNTRIRLSGCDIHNNTIDDRTICFFSSSQTAQHLIVVGVRTRRCVQDCTALKIIFLWLRVPNKHAATGTPTHISYHASWACKHTCFQVL